MQRPDHQDQRPHLYGNLSRVLMRSDSRICEGTIMGQDCLRVDGNFLAMLATGNKGLVVKLPRERVSALIAEGIGCAFAPAGVVFGEWVSISEPDRVLWSILMNESLSFVG